MGWASGVFTRVRDWTADAAGAFPNIEATLMDQEDDNFELGIDTCLTKDGQNTPTGNLPMDSNRHTGVGNAQAKTDYASAADVMDQDLIFYVDSGAADAYVITPDPSIGAYAEGQRLIFRATNANTGAATLNVNAIGAIAIETNDASALEANMIADGGYYEVTYDANGTRFVLTSPHSLTEVNETRNLIAGTGMTGGGTLAADRTFNVIGGDGITANANDIALSASVAGAGMTHTAGVLNVIGGTGITVNANDVALNPSSTLNTDHSAISMIAGTGMTGGGAIGANRTFNVIGGDGITANADDIELSASVAGAGMTHTAGVLNVIGGDGITANANDVALTDAGASTTNPVDISSGVVSLDVAALDTIEGSALGATDTFLIDDNGVTTGIEQQAMGLRIRGNQTTQTLAAADMNTILTIPLNASVDLPLGVPIVLNVKHATQVLTVTAATSVTLTSINHPGGGSAASDTVNVRLAPIAPPLSVSSIVSPERVTTPFKPATVIMLKNKLISRKYPHLTPNRQ